LLEAGNLTATSMGLQPFKIVVVSNSDLQKKLVPLSYNQGHVAEASHLLVFAIDTEINASMVDSYIERAMELRKLPFCALEQYHIN
jgi:nitroreductase/dihydropteridine reductase